MPTKTESFALLSGWGSINQSNATYATARNATTGTVDNNGSIVSLQTSFSGGTYFIRRVFLPIDTTSIPGSATIDSATLYFKISNFQGNADTSSVNLVQSTQTSVSSLATGDYDNIGASSGGSVSMSFSNNTTHSITLNSTGLGFINPGGNTLIALRSSLDLNSSTPTGLNQSTLTTTSTDHYLQIQYTYTSGALFFGM
jgi:hypothetical protein